MNQRIECLSCGHVRLVDRPGECPECGYVGWAPVDDISETLRRRLRQRPLRDRRVAQTTERRAS